MSEATEIERCRPYIEAALSQEYAGGTHTFADVRAAVESGEAQLWPGRNSAIVTQILLYPQQKTLYLWLGGGTLAEIEEMLSPVYEWARKEGCTRAMLAGRRGWERTFLARTGWEKQEVVIMEKSL